MNEIQNFLRVASLTAILNRYPPAKEFLANYNLSDLTDSKPFPDALGDIPQENLDEFGLTADDLITQLADFLHVLYSRQQNTAPIESLTIIGGQNKSGTQENITCTLHAGEIISIVGPTGSGKSRLLADIECLAQADTPTKRTILINDRPLSLDERFQLGTHLVAQLSQNMNFVLDVSVEEFLTMHAQSRLINSPATILDACYQAALTLSGEPFDRHTKVTQLSGGQSRALMIADTAYISSSPIVLIDEIENAGIDRKQALDLLTQHDKIVLIATHDPLLALRADRRIIIQDGGIADVLHTTEEEKASLSRIAELEQTLSSVQHSLRIGERINILHD